MNAWMDVWMEGWRIDSRKSAVKALEKARMTHTNVKRDLKKNVTIENVNLSVPFVCRVCDNPCLPFIGLKFHLWSHE